MNITERDNLYLFEIFDVILLQVTESALDDNLNRGIKDFTLLALEEKWLILGVNFIDPFAISKFITDPDFLDIQIIRPDLFVSSVTGLRL